MEIEEAELRDALRPILADTAADREAGWRAVAEAGWTALLAPEAAGGLGQTLTAAGWLYREAGRALSPVPVLPALMAGDAIAACPASGERDGWLERLAGGERIAASLLDPASASIRIEGERIVGRLAGVEDAGGAAHLLVAVAEPPLLAIVAIDRIAVTPRETWDDTRALGDVALDVALADATVLARDAEARPAIERLRTHLHFGIAADCVGAADAILGETVAYLQTRRQFDRPLAMFQALKHRCADLKAEIVAADALLRDRLSAAETGDASPVVAARTAKAFASRTFRAVAEEAMQLHGGMSMTREHPCHRYLKRALLNEHLASADDACELAVAAAVLGDA